MKLEEIAQKSIELIKKAGNEGITTYALADELGVPKRRIYDVKAIMKAADLISTKRDQKGTTMVWNSRPLDEKNLQADRIKIYTDGIITKVSNRSTYVIVEASRSDLTVETIFD